MSRTTLLWLVWGVATALTGAAAMAMMYVGGPRDALLIGETTGAHHQIEATCESCHTASFFASPKKASKAMNKACLACHKDELALSNDSHPVKKFRDPRNIDRRAQLDALYCHTCHAEHKPEITRSLAVSLPLDYCTACHQEVFENRPSHKGLGFDTCASSGCHNYHDNTALYEKFLVKHADAPDIAETPVIAASSDRGVRPVALALGAEDPAATLSAYLADEDDPAAAAEAALAKALDATGAVAPDAYLTPKAVTAWDGSAHALAGVNCAGCHAEDAPAGNLAAIEAAWVEAPDLKTCQSCHKDQVRTFTEGKHGMRRHRKIAKPRKAPKGGIEAVAYRVLSDAPLRAMTVGESALPMKAEAGHLEIGDCAACHKPHEVDLKVAAVDACVGCHDDDHTTAYFASPHYQLWRAELAGDAAPGSGVSCADCHMPKIEARRGGFVTTHNQNAYLRPNEKMIRAVCMNCHGLAFAIDALADPDLVESNFDGRPSTHIESVDWALRRVRKTQ